MLSRSCACYYSNALEHKCWTHLKINEVEWRLGSPNLSLHSLISQVMEGTLKFAVRNF